MNKSEIAARDNAAYIVESLALEAREETGRAPSREQLLEASAFIEGVMYRDYIGGRKTDAQTFRKIVQKAKTRLTGEYQPAQFSESGERIKGNPRDVRASSKKEEYNDFDEWQRDAFAAGATQIVKIGEDAFSALRTKDGSMVELDEEGYFDPRSRSAIKGRNNRINIGAWYMDSGTIYRHIIKNHPEFFAYENPVRPRRGESSRDFVSRCMGEEKMSFPEPKQRIAVCLSKSRKRNPVFDTGADE